MASIRFLLDLHALCFPLLLYVLDSLLYPYWLWVEVSLSLVLSEDTRFEHILFAQGFISFSLKSSIYVSTMLVVTTSRTQEQVTGMFPNLGSYRLILLTYSMLLKNIYVI